MSARGSLRSTCPGVCVLFIMLTLRGMAAVSPYSVSPLSNCHALTPPNESGRSAPVSSYHLSTAKPTIDLFPAFAVVMRGLSGTDGFSRPMRWLDRKLEQASRQEWADKVIRLRCV
jgi:hypothetical protein